MEGIFTGSATKIEHRIAGMKKGQQMPPHASLCRRPAPVLVQEFGRNPLPADRSIREAITRYASTSDAVP